VYSKLLVLVRNKHPPAPAHGGKGLGEVIDPGRRENQVDDAIWRALLGLCSLFRRPAEVAFLGHGEKVAEMAELHGRPNHFN
jgi:hypothetical protein